MDDWYRRVAVELVSETPAASRQPSTPEGPMALEIALGHVRSAIAYVLELARAHRLPASGNVTGDHVSLQLGDRRLRATLNRRGGHMLLVVTGRDDAHLRWDDAKHAIVDANGARADLAALAREAIDGMVSAWRAGPATARHSSGPRTDFDEDEPTKG
jgi:hypothetical protein